jgi:CRISPR/Cas system Type II protein with McrA/HNH and RuvC-like nuclease domain
LESKKPTNDLKICDSSEYFNIYEIRVRALDEKIDLVELLLALININKYRGYKEFYLDRSFEEKDKEAKKTYEAVREAEKIFQENNYRSVAEMVIKNERFRHYENKNLLAVHNRKPKEGKEKKEEVKKNLRNLIFPRQLLEEEIRKILAKQAEYYPQLKKQFTYKL